MNFFLFFLLSQAVCSGVLRQGVLLEINTMEALNSLNEENALKKKISTCKKVNKYQILNPARTINSIASKAA